MALAQPLPRRTTAPIRIRPHSRRAAHRRAAVRPRSDHATPLRRAWPPRRRPGLPVSSVLHATDRPLGRDRLRVAPSPTCSVRDHGRRPAEFHHLRSQRVVGGSMIVSSMPHNPIQLETRVARFKRTESLLPRKPRVTAPREAKRIAMRRAWHRAQGASETRRATSVSVSERRGQRSDRPPARRRPSAWCTAAPCVLA
jgi:hypothetical protein